MGQIETLLEEEGGSARWDQLCNLAKARGWQLPRLAKVKELPGFSGAGDTIHPRTPLTPGGPKLIPPPVGGMCHSNHMGQGGEAWYPEPMIDHTIWGGGGLLPRALHRPYHMERREGGLLRVSGKMWRAVF